MPHHHFHGKRTLQEIIKKYIIKKKTLVADRVMWQSLVLPGDIRRLRTLKSSGKI
jgi:hypothetical protein